LGSFLLLFHWIYKDKFLLHLSMPMIHNLGLFMKSQSSCLFLFQVLSLCLRIPLFFNLIPILSLSPDILSFTSSNMLQ
jgi:hypothetical protein